MPRHQLSPELELRELAGMDQQPVVQYPPAERDPVGVVGGRSVSARPLIIRGKNTRHLPTDPAERKKVPLYSGLLKYFPDALVEVAHLSYVGNKQHNPGEPLHWAREKSTDQEDTIMRHLLESGSIDSDGVRHTAKVAWRALALLQLEIEKERNIDSIKETTSTRTSV